MAKKEKQEKKTLFLKSVARKPQIFNLKGKEGALYLDPGSSHPISESEISQEVQAAMYRKDIIIQEK